MFMYKRLLLILAALIGGQANNASAQLIPMADIEPAFAQDNPGPMSEVNGSLMIQLTNGFGRDIWSVTGGEDPELLISRSEHDRSFKPSNLFYLADTLYFSAITTSLGRELWRRTPDGSVELVADVFEGEFSGFDRLLAVIDGEAYFDGTDSTSLDEVWRFSPASGVERVVDLWPGEQGSNPGASAVLNGDLYVMATTETSGTELWRIQRDGTATLTHDVSPGTQNTWVEQILSWDDALYYVTSNTGEGEELWSYSPGSGPNRITRFAVHNAFPTTELVVWNDALYFGAFDTDSVLGLWRYSPSEGLVLVGDETSSSPDLLPTKLAASESGIYFTSMGFTEGFLKFYDGDNIRILAPIALAFGYEEAVLATVGDVAYYATHTESEGVELWRASPQSGAELVGETVEGEAGSFPRELTPYGDDLYFTARTDPNRPSPRTLWKLESARSTFESPNPANSEGEIRVGPNPARDAVYFTIPPEQQSTATIDIYDVTGRRVLEHAVALSTSDTQVSVATGHLPSGTYLYTIHSRGLRLSGGTLVVVR